MPREILPAAGPSLRARGLLGSRGRTSLRGGEVISSGGQITGLIKAHADGDSAAYDQAVALLYDELRTIAHGQLARVRANGTLQTTAIVNEAYIRLRDRAGGAVSREHFLAVAARAIRHLVIDYARSRRAEKRGGGAAHLELEEGDATVAAEAEHIVQINDALAALSDQNPRLLEVFECKFFAGLNDEETANALDLSVRTAQRDWMKARAFLSERLAD